mgnify:CR=1 FL=1
MDEQNTARGFTLPETLTVLAIIALIASVSTALINPMRRHLLLRARAAEIRGTLDHVRALAIARQLGDERRARALESVVVEKRV